MGASDFAAVLGVWLLAIVSPGPDVVLVLREGVHRGRAGALAAAAGVTGGIVAWIALAMAGAHLLVEADDRILGTLQLLGGLYLAYLGLGGLRAAMAARRPAPGAGPPRAGEDAAAAAPDPASASVRAASAPAPTPASPPVPASTARAQPGGPARSFGRGLLTNLSNPKALVFFGTVFSVLVPESASVGSRAGLSVLLIATAGLWFGSLAWLATTGRVGRFLGRHAAAFDALAGVTFTALGLFALATGVGTLR